MNGPDGNTLIQNQLAEDQAKIRNCLRCNTPFASAWSGERVCRRCKSSGIWKRGLATNFGNKRSLRRVTPQHMKREAKESLIGRHPSPVEDSPLMANLGRLRSKIEGSGLKKKADLSENLSLCIAKAGLSQFMRHPVSLYVSF